MQFLHSCCLWQLWIVLYGKNFFKFKSNPSHTHTQFHTPGTLLNAVSLYNPNPKIWSTVWPLGLSVDLLNDCRVRTYVTEDLECFLDHDEHGEDKEEVRSACRSERGRTLTTASHTKLPSKHSVRTHTDTQTHTDTHTLKVGIGRACLEACAGSCRPTHCCVLRLC